MPEFLQEKCILRLFVLFLRKGGTVSIREGTGALRRHALQV